MAYIEIKDATKWYPHKSGKLRDIFRKDKSFVKAVDGVNLSMDRGEILGVIGESGCGKTTTALSICQLLPKEGSIEGGEILVEGLEYANLSEEEIKKHRWEDVSIIF